MATSNAPDGQIITYALGSCIGLSAYDPVMRIGGLIHIMLPEPGKGETQSDENPFIYASSGLPIFFDELYSLGAMKVRLELKMAGGASLFNANKMFNIGDRNIEYIQSYIKSNGFTLRALAIGGTSSRTMTTHLINGKVLLKIPGIGEVEL